MDSTAARCSVPNTGAEWACFEDCIAVSRARSPEAIQPRLASARAAARQPRDEPIERAGRNAATIAELR